MFCAVTVRINDNPSSHLTKLPQKNRRRIGCCSVFPSYSPGIDFKGNLCLLQIFHSCQSRLQIGIAGFIKILSALVKFCQQIKMSNPGTPGSVPYRSLQLIVITDKGVPVAFPETIYCLCQLLFCIIYGNKFFVFLYAVGRAYGILCLLDRSQAVQLDPNIKIHSPPVFVTKLLQFSPVFLQNSVIHSKARLTKGIISVSGDTEVRQSLPKSGLYHLARRVFSIAECCMRVEICSQIHNFSPFDASGLCTPAAFSPLSGYS